MSRVLLLDTGPAGKIAHPKADPALTQWIRTRLSDGDTIVLPEIVDYELRRNFILELRRGQAQFQESIRRLDELRQAFRFLPISSNAMLRAAELWAYGRSIGKPAADKKALDGDVILAAQALEVDGLIVTDNPRHLSLFVSVLDWRDD
jgi:predicted nucleic acid-binding protein